MHCLVTVLTPHPNNIHRIMDFYCRQRTWDYCCLGGRYQGLIPVGKNVKKRFRADNFLQPVADDEFQFTPDFYEHNDRCKYISAARLRSIDWAELRHMKEMTRYDVFHPYQWIIDIDDQFNLIDNDDPTNTDTVEWIHSEIIENDARQHWYAIVIDAHY